MRNIKLTLQYDGTNYAGWQVQKNAKTVQEVLQNTIKCIVGERVNLIASGRTDSGVHASAQVANFKTKTKIPALNLQMALNFKLPKDIAVVSAEDVPLKFNSQHCARSKVYRYTIVNDDYMYPLLRHYAAKCFYKLDLLKMKKAARLIVGRKDFKAFMTNDGMGEKDTVRKVKRISIKKQGRIITIDIEADGFLYNMARAIVGTLIDIGRGKMKVDDIKSILRSKDRRYSGPTAAAEGLCLVRVNYR